MPFYVKRTDAWTKVRKLYVKRQEGTNGTWTDVKRGYIKRASGWTQFWPQVSPTIDFPLEITRSSATWPSTLTGKNYHWDNADTLTYKFQWSLTDTTNNSAWTDLMSYTTITNPAIGSSNTKTFSITSANFSSTVRSKWFRFVVKAVDTTNDITTIEYSNTVNISKTDLVGTPGTVVIARQSSTSYVYAVTNNGTWSDTPASYEYQWQNNDGGGWTNITTGATGQTTSSITFTSPQSYLDQQIRCQVTAVDDVGALSALPITSNTLTVVAAPASINSFTVIGDSMQAFYSYDVSSAYNVGNGLTIEIVFQRKNNDGTWLTTNTIFPSSKTGTNVTVLFNDGGTYRGTIYVRDGVNPEISFTTPEFSVGRMFFRNVAINVTSTGFTAPSNINFSNTWMPGDSTQTGSIGWTNGANMNTTDVTWSGNYNDYEFNKAVSGQGQYVTFPLSETVGNASITAIVEQTGLGQATISWEQEGSQSYRIIYRVDSNVSPGYVDIPVTGNYSGTFASQIVNATNADVSVRALYLYSLPNQTGREFGSTITFPPLVTLGAGTKLSTTASGTINLLTAPTAPTGLSKTAEDNGRLTFSWSPPTSDGGTPVTRYDVMVIQNGVGSYVSNGLSTTYTATFSTGNTGVFYVRAVNAWAMGPAASTANLYIPEISAGPVGTSTTATTTRASWTSYYQTGYSLSLGNFTYTGTTATHRDITGLSASTPYPVALSINSVTGNTASQSLSYAITGASTTGSVVTYITNNQLRAGQRVLISGVTPSSYNMNATVASATRTSFTVATYVAPGTTYSSGGTASAIINTLAGVPTVTTSNITIGGFTASWSAAGASKYYVDIYRSSTGTSIAGYPTFTNSTTSGALTGLVQGASYSISVQSVNNIDQLSTATVQSVTTAQGYTVTFTTNGATFGTPSVSSVTQDSIGGSVTLATVGTMGKPGYTFGGWTINGVSYPSGGTYTPTANVNASAIWNLAGTAPSTPTNVSGSDNLSPSGGTFSWTASTGTAPITYYYQIIRQFVGVAASGSTTSTSVTTSLTGTFYISLYASNSYGDSSTTSSSPITFTTKSTSPSTPTGLTNSYSSGPTWTGSWTPSTGGSGTITYYWTLYQSASVGGTINATASGSTTGTSFTKTMYPADGLWAYFTVYASAAGVNSGTATSGWA